MKIRLEVISCAQLYALAKEWLDPRTIYGASALLSSEDPKSVLSVGSYADTIADFKRKGVAQDTVTGIYADDVFVGYVCPMNIPVLRGKQETCMIGFSLAPSARGRGIYRCIRDNTGIICLKVRPRTDYLALADKEFAA